MSQPAAAIHLDDDVALVVFEVLSRWSVDGRPLEVTDAGEEYALHQILDQLESQLVSPLQRDYRPAVGRALVALRHRAGIA